MKRQPVCCWHRAQASRLSYPKGLQNAPCTPMASNSRFSLYYVAWAFASAGCLKRPCGDPVPPSWCYTVCSSPHHSWNDFFKHEIYNWDSEEKHIPWKLHQRKLESMVFRKQVSFGSLILSWTDALSRHEHFNTSIWPQKPMYGTRSCGCLLNREASPWIHSKCHVSQ